MDRVLILGGTHFIGRNMVAYLNSLASVEITLFNRGITNKDLFPGISQIHGDRNTSDIDVIFDENWDYIVDFSCFFPDALDRVLTHLDKGLKRYIFISTCSVYDHDADTSKLRTEAAPTLSCSTAEAKDPGVQTYGRRKAECERILAQRKLKFSIFRPALVYGQYDPTDRLYYWLYHVKNGNPLLIPDRGERVFSVTYVRDLVEAIVLSLNDHHPSDIYNITTVPAVSILKIIKTAAEVLGQYPVSYFASPSFLHEQQVAQWTDLPLWLDDDEHTYDHGKIREDLGLKIADFKDSISKTIRYYDALGWPEPKHGITEGRKEELIRILSGTAE